MDPVTFVLIPGFIGGAVFAWGLIKWHQRSGARPIATPTRDDPHSTDVINIAHISVAGVGGLGLVAMAAVVALAIPRIRQHVAWSFVIGAALAAALILCRRRRGPLPSTRATSRRLT